MQKTNVYAVCIYIFQMSFHFAYHRWRWWLGPSVSLSRTRNKNLRSSKAKRQRERVTPPSAILWCTPLQSALQYRICGWRWVSQKKHFVSKRKKTTAEPFYDLSGFALSDVTVCRVRSASFSSLSPLPPLWDMRHAPRYYVHMYE